MVFLRPDVHEVSCFELRLGKGFSRTNPQPDGSIAFRLGLDPRLESIALKYRLDQRCGFFADSLIETGPNLAGSATLLAAYGQHRLVTGVGNPIGARRSGFHR